MRAEGGKSAVLIAGPTASGKSGLGLSVAEKLAAGGQEAVIVNVDSMQVYKELSVITAAPDEDERARAPHRLYGEVSAAEVFSTGEWLRRVNNVLQEEFDRQRIPILLGGTGLYFKALTEGLAEIPAITPEIRQRIRSDVENLGTEAMYERLVAIDPDSAVSIKPNDGQRIGRALEVFESTGKQLSHWQKQTTSNAVLKDKHLLRCVLMPDREWLYARINQRFDQMVEEGALEEVRRLLELNLSGDMPLMKAIGVPQFASYLKDEWSLDEAIENAKMETRRYAKRQMTWFRNQMNEDWRRYDPSAEKLGPLIEAILA